MSTSPTFSRGAQLLLNNLIPEILSEIFLACIDSRWDTEPSLSSAPISVSQVCRRWRQVALSTPRLWSTFRLFRQSTDGDLEGGIAIMRVIPVLKHWIKRSSFAPLDFSIWIRLDDPPEELTEEIESLLRLLFSHQVRWKFAAIHYFAPLPRWFDATLFDMPMLRQLQLALECDTIFDRFFRVDLSRSSGLRFLILQGNIKLIGSDPLPNLVYVSIHPGGISSNTFPTLHDCYEILQRSPSLEKIDAYCESSSRESSFEQVNLGKLQSFKLLLMESFVTLADMSRLFECLTLPSLNSLEINCHYIINESPVGAQLLGMLRRSKAPVNSLALRSSAAKQDQLVALLQLLPSLKELRLDGMNSVDSVLTNLTLTGTGCDICPNLEKIQIWFIEDLSLPLLSNYIASRWRPRATKEDRGPFSRLLKEVSVMHCSVRGELSQEVHGYIEEGLIVELTRTYPRSWFKGFFTIKTMFAFKRPIAEKHCNSMGLSEAT